MNHDEAVDAFGALAQDVRLKVFRLLVAEGPKGLPAGQIALRLGVPASTLSSHLAYLERVSLLRSWRLHRRVFYAADFTGVGRLVSFLIDECCGGNPGLCGYAGREPAGIDRNLGRPRLAVVPQRDDRSDPCQQGDTTMSDKSYNVLFICTGNSARSILSECIMNRLGQGRFRGGSAGSFPKGQVHPYALDLLHKQNYVTEDLRSKNWDEFAGPDAPPLDFVFTVCDNAAGEVCPIWPGQPMSAHWGVPDPAAAEGTEAERRLAFADAYRMLEQRISIFVNLPIHSLDRLALQKHLDEIGRTVPEGVKA